MITAGVSPRMMAQKTQVAGISGEPTAVPGPVPDIPNGPGSSPPRRPLHPGEVSPPARARTRRRCRRLGRGSAAAKPSADITPLLAQRGVLAGGGDPEPLLRDADALDLHPGRQLRDAEGEVRQAAEDVGRHSAEVGDLDVDLVAADLGDLGRGIAAEAQDVDGRLELVRTGGGQRDAL